jgi:hypothetical protein
MGVVVRDLNGRPWVVRRTFAPWWRLFQPINLFRKDRPMRRSPVAPGGRRQSRPEPMSWWRETLLELVGPFVLAALAVVFLVGSPLELVAVGLAGAPLYVLRSLRLVSHRIDVMGMEGDEVRSLSVVLVKGSRRDADAMVDRLRARLAESDTIDLGVPVHAHEGYWT